MAGTGGLTIERLRGTGEKVVAYSDAPFESEDQARMDGCVRTTLRAPMLRASKSALPEEAVTYYLWTGSATDLCFEVDSVGNRDQKTKMSGTTRCSGSRNCALTNRHEESRARFGSLLPLCDCNTSMAEWQSLYQTHFQRTALDSAHSFHCDWYL